MTLFFQDFVAKIFCADIIAGSTSGAAGHGDYQPGGLGVTQMPGEGGLSPGADVPKASYDNGEVKNGLSFSAGYARRFSDRTDLQLLTYRCQSQGDVEFADVNPKDIWRYARTGGQRSRYEARLSHRSVGTCLRDSYWPGVWFAATGPTGTSPGAIENPRARRLQPDERARRRGLSEEAVRERVQQYDARWTLWAERQIRAALLLSTTEIIYEKNTTGTGTADITLLRPQ